MIRRVLCLVQYNIYENCLKALFIGYICTYRMMLVDAGLSISSRRRRRVGGKYCAVLQQYFSNRLSPNCTNMSYGNKQL